MREALLAVIDRVGALPRAGADAADIPLVEFLSWMVEDHFTFLGYRRYALESQDGADVLRIVAGSGLGILRDGDAAQESQAFAELPPELRREAHTPQTLLLTKTSARATVHRPVTLDYVGIKRFDAAGKVVGEDRFLGLYGSRAYSCVPQEIPILRQKIEQVMRRADLDPNSHSYKSLQHVLESYPRDELFQIDADELYRIATGILQLDEQQRSRLFVRRDPYGRFMVCLVYVPRERYDTQVRKRMQRILREAFGGDEVEFVVSLTDAPLARILFTVHTRPGAVPEFNVDEIEARLVDAMLSWQDRLHAALLEQLGEEKGSALAARFGEGFPAGYREDFGARTAVHDIEQMVLMDDAHELRMILYRPLEARAEHLRFKVYRYARALPLHKALPMLEHMGVRVEDERPFKVEDAAGNVYWVHDFGLRHPG